MLYAIMDIGSSSIRLAVYHLEKDSMDLLLKKKHAIGLAGFIDNGCMSQAGIDKTVEIVKDFKNFLANFPIAAMDAITTAALRNCRNSKAAVCEIEKRTGISLRVISGDEEATFDFIGATHNRKDGSGLLVDIGGGSTEIVSYEHREIRFKISVPMGALSLRTDLVHGFLPSAAECQAMKAESERMFDQVRGLQQHCAPAIIGMGGTFKSACALYNRLYHCDRHNTRMDVLKIEQMISEFQRDIPLTEEKTIVLMKAVPDRMHTIISGLIIADVLASRLGSSRISYSDTGVREGFICAEILPLLK
ncbi:hypothetical protein [Allisonella histaminiformans]|uniref:Ppx/GppA phosphatase family protein n=1 Tax=Allisonella histaminiformans TaxID=209880 RepID=UPI0038907F54